MRKLLNWIFVAHLVVVGLVLTGIVPRSIMLWETAALILYFFAIPIEDGIIFFVRSIPLWIALPLTATYDNLNVWRLLAIVLFLKWLFSRETWHYLISGLIVLAKHPRAFYREHRWLTALVLLFIVAALSLWHEPFLSEGIKRLIYFLNAAIIGVVIALPPRGKAFIERLIKNITVPVIIVTLVGVAQVASTYFMDIYQFMRVWGEGIQLREFGTTWSYIAVHVGNTWFAYFGDQLSLRVFSLFPDSHSFPIFLLLGLPAFFAWTLKKPIEKSERLRAMIHTRGKIAVLWIPLIFLMMILSGTRGIWAGGIAMIVWVPLVLWYLHHRKAAASQKNIFKYLSTYIVLFFLLFGVAYPIFSSPQFLVSKGDSLLLERRLRSILDLGETSNSQRLDIWKKSLIAIEHHPVLGVGLADFPVVLEQNIQLSKAGSSAHNIYLHVAAEMGLGALVLFLWFLWLAVKGIADQFLSARDPRLQAYFGSLLFTFPWILAYLMTDVAIFDERALLLCITTLGIVASAHRHV